MKTTKKGETPELLAGAAGVSEKVESGSCGSPDISITRSALNGNEQFPDPIVEAIRILARRGRQLREAEEAAAAASQDAQRQGAGAGGSDDDALFTQGERTAAPEIDRAEAGEGSSEYGSTKPRGNRRHPVEREI